jgi:hypothetical protein
VHKPTLSVKHEPDCHAVGVLAHAVDRGSIFAWRRGAGSASQHQRSVVANLLGGHRTQLRSQFVATRELSIEEFLRSSLSRLSSCRNPESMYLLRFAIKAEKLIGKIDTNTQAWARLIPVAPGS